MKRTAETAEQAAKLSALKEVLATRHFATLETLEEAVDEVLWGEDTQLENGPDSTEDFTAKSADRCRLRASE